MPTSLPFRQISVLISGGVAHGDQPVDTMKIPYCLRDFHGIELHVVYPGEKRYRLAKKVEVVPLTELAGAK